MDNLAFCYTWLIFAQGFNYRFDVSVRVTSRFRIGRGGGRATSLETARRTLIAISRNNTWINIREGRLRVTWSTFVLAETNVRSCFRTLWIQPGAVLMRMRISPRAIGLDGNETRFPALYISPREMIPRIYIYISLIKRV